MCGADHLTYLAVHMPLTGAVGVDVIVFHASRSCLLEARERAPTFCHMCTVELYIDDVTTIYTEPQGSTM